ncbi:MAG: DNA adenine methylase [Acidothermaceae bacterium]
MTSPAQEAFDLDRTSAVADAIARASSFPRLRYMGSKYKLVPHLAQVFADLGGRTALDAFSGSGVVSFSLKALGYAVTSNDFLAFPAAIARATVVNQTTLLTEADLDFICGPASDDRDFISRTFAGLYFTPDDLRFLDAAWSNIELLAAPKKDLAIAALVLSAARKQPRGVFTVTSLRYDDGRRDLHLPLAEHFRERAAAYNSVIFDNCQVNTAICAEIKDVDNAGFDIVYLDPPYAPPRDDNCYIKRYHFLEGLSVYWRDLQIMHQTQTKKLAKRFTPFSYKHTIVAALADTFERFRDSTIVLSYSSNAVPDHAVISALLREVKGTVEMRPIEHRYSFGTHANAARRTADEYLFIGY